MSNYTKKVVDQFEFDGDTVKVSFRRLKRTEFQNLLPFFKMGDDGKKVEMEFKSEEEFLSVVETYVSTCVEQMSGLWVDGEQLIYDKSTGTGAELFAEIVGSFYFIPLVQKIVVSIIVNSAPPVAPAELKK